MKTSESEPHARSRGLRGRRAAVIGAWIVLGAFGTAVYVAWDSLVELWHIQRLERNDPLEVIDSVRELGRRKSLKAVPAILRAMKRVGESPGHKPDFLLLGPASIQPGSSVDVLPTGHERLELQKTICDVGPPATAELLRIISDDDPELSLWAANFLPRVMEGISFGTCVHYPWQSRPAMIHAFELGIFRSRLPEALRGGFDRAVERLRQLELHKVSQAVQ